MRCSLRHRNLQPVIVRPIIVRQPVDVAQVRKFARKGPGCLFRISVRTAVVKRRRAGQTHPRPTRRDCGISPTWTEAPDQLRLIQIRNAYQLRPMVADIGNIDRQVVRDRVLEVEIPLADVRRPQIAIHPHDGAGLRR